jgi:CheY-like chemotaxis protein
MVNCRPPICLKKAQILLRIEQTKAKRRGTVLAGRRLEAIMGTKNNCHKRILIVEDEEVLAENLAVFLRSTGAKVVIAHSGEQALRVLGNSKPDWVVSDYNLPGMNGLETIASIRERYPDILCVLMTAEPSSVVIAAAWELGVVQVLAKPFPLPELRSHIFGAREEDAERTGIVLSEMTFATQ